MTTAVALKLTPAEVDLIDLIVHLGERQSRSAVLREGLMILAEKFVAADRLMKLVDHERQDHRPRRAVRAGSRRLRAAVFGDEATEPVHYSRPLIEALDEGALPLPKE
jgi:Arc/MetJ-type ribon-helix-helix transcriptional regulator